MRNSSWTSLRVHCWSCHLNVSSVRAMSQDINWSVNQFWKYHFVMHYFHDITSFLIWQKWRACWIWPQLDYILLQQNWQSFFFILMPFFYNNFVINFSIMKQWFQRTAKLNTIATCFYVILLLLVWNSDTAWELQNWTRLFTKLWKFILVDTSSSVSWKLICINFSRLKSWAMTTSATFCTRSFVALNTYTQQMCCIEIWNRATYYSTQHATLRLNSSAHFFACNI